MVLDLAVLVLTIWKGFTQWRRDASPLVKTLYRDGILYFILLFTISMVNFILFRATTLTVFYDLLLELQRVLHSVLSARIILHARIAAEEAKAWARGSLPVIRDEQSTMEMAFDTRDTACSMMTGAYSNTS